MSYLFDYARAFSGFLTRRNLKHLIAHVTNSCNFRCEHCFIDFAPDKDMKLDQFKALAKQVGPLFWLDIGGGEPFLRKDLADIVCSFDAKVVQIPSNGSLHDQMIEQVKWMKSRSSAEIGVSFSLDGLEKTHGKIRGQEKSWDQVWTAFELLREIGGVPVKINTVLTNHNKDEIIDLMKEVRRRGPDFHSIIFVRGESQDQDVALPEIEELRRLEPEIFSILETYDYGAGKVSAHILRNYHRYLWSISIKTIVEKRQVIPCLGGEAHMVVWSDGGVSSCELLENIGDLKTQTWNDILESDARRAQLRAIKNGECHCTHNCAILDSVFFSPTCMPKLLFKTIRAS